ncbi:phytanoyl-CoA dioxygenase family protein [Myxococcota bacterium]|nr:phytanoyl-CoA dioxygenase family protein [Myxococcota bacterium]
MTERERRAYEAHVRAEGFCVVEGFFPREKLLRWRDALLALLRERITEGTASARGHQRYYASLPFTAPWADPRIYEDPDLLAIVERLGGGDIVMPELASDTPLPGAEHQVIHRDATQRSKDLPDLDPAEPFQFAVNFPLVDVTVDKAPFEIVRGTHVISDEEAKALVASGEAERRLEPLLMKVGDVMIRDVRGLHRGSPNRTSEPRPMIVVGYNRRAHQRPQLRIYVPKAEHARLSARAKKLLEPNPIVDSLEDAIVGETYADLDFLDPYA